MNHKLSEVLQVWIDTRTFQVCWRTIITVVEDPPVENKVVANEIESRMGFGIFLENFKVEYEITK